MSDFKVGIKALAYERGHPKTKLSEFENDLEFVRWQELLEELTKLKEWILSNGGMGNQGVAVQGGNLDGGDIALRDTTMLRREVNGQDITERLSLPLRYYFFAGDVRALLADSVTTP